MAMARVVAQTVGAGVVRRSAFATARAVLRTGTVLCDTPVALASCARLHTVAVDGVPPEVAEAMPRCIRELVGSQALVGETVTVQGWVRSCRAQKTVSFVEVGDGSALAGLQVVVPKGVAIDGGEAADGRRVPVGASVRVTGVLAESPGKKSQSVELQAASLSVVGSCDGSTYPLQKKGHSTEFLRDIVHLRPRTNLIGAVTRVRHHLAQGLRSSLCDEGFFEVSTPVLTSNDCEGAGELFSVTAPKDSRADGDSSSGKFFGKDAYLTVSGQLHAEAFATALSKVYTFGPTFRAEDSNTSRHLAEFWMLEPEVAFASLEDVIDLGERCVQESVKRVMDNCEEDLAFFNLRVDNTCLDRLETTISRPFERLSHAEAVGVLHKLGATQGDEDGGLSTEQEKILCDHVGRPTFVMDYPAGCKPFYMRRNDDGETVACFDLLVPRLGELIGGSAREERFDVLQRIMQEEGLLREGSGDSDAPAAGMGDVESSDLQWYLDLRRFGSVPHAGWGLGFERLVQFATGVENIRDAIPVPRAPRLCRL